MARLSKKSLSAKSKTDTATSHREGESSARYVSGDSGKALMQREARGNNKGPRKPDHINPESEEARAKRLAARKARTLRAFQITYENHHRRKAS